MNILHHLGLGDHILCNGLIRSLPYDSIVLCCKKHNAPSVAFMFRDMNVTIDTIASDADIDKYANSMREPFLKIGYKGEGWNVNEGRFDSTFYKQAGIDFNNRWEKFHIPRDLTREREFMKQFNVKPHEYIFVHEDVTRGYCIPNIETDLTIVRPIFGMTNVIFDYCILMQEAAEVHCIDSSFLHIAESIPLSGRVYYHKSVRGSDGFYDATLRGDWIIK